MATIKGVTFKNNRYGILEVNYKGNLLPVLMDGKHLKTFQACDKTWRCNASGLVLCTHSKKGATREIFLHEVIKALEEGRQEIKDNPYPILHLNRIGLDNRACNLRYNKPEESQRNTSKKKRTIKLPKESGIEADTLPTYVWYMKPQGTHGDRFLVSIGGSAWKTSGSKRVSLKKKLEQAKDYLRDLKKEKPHLFHENCMNGEFTVEGKKRLKEYYDIIEKAGYNLERSTTDNLTAFFLQ
jgi:hypothetical protein